MKIPFDIKYRPQIESGEYTVENRDGVHVTILEWDIFIHGMDHMMLIRYNDKYEFVHSNGRINRTGQDCNLDLFIVTPEEELTDFEKKLWEVLKSEGSPIGPIEKFTNADNEVFHSYAAKLLPLAREQFIKDGYIIEKKAFHDAVEKIDDRHKAEIENQCKIQIAMTKDTFLDLVELMRKTQREYFATRSPQALTRARKFEKEVDLALIDIRENGFGTGLFPG